MGNWFSNKESEELKEELKREREKSSKVLLQNKALLQKDKELEKASAKKSQKNFTDSFIDLLLHLCTFKTPIF